LGPFKKDVRTKSQNWLLPPLPCRHTLNFEKSEVFCIKKVQTSASEETPLLLVCTEQILLHLWVRTSFMDGPLVEIRFQSNVFSSKCSRPPFFKLI